MFGFIRSVKPDTSVEVLDFEPLTPKQRRRELVRLLRKLDAEGELTLKAPGFTDPVKLTWNYSVGLSEKNGGGHCGCAAGISYLAFGKNLATYDVYAEKYDVAECHLRDVFMYTGVGYYSSRHHEVTAGHVADAFEKLG